MLKVFIGQFATFIDDVYVGIHASLDMYKYALPSSCRRTMIKLSRDSTAIHRENYTQISTAPKLTKSLKMASLYQQTIPVFIKYLKAMDGLLVKGEKYADENEVAHDDMINYRIVPDMRG